MNFLRPSDVGSKIIVVDPLLGFQTWIFIGILKVSFATSKWEFFENFIRGLFNEVMCTKPLAGPLNVNSLGISFVDY